MFTSQNNADGGEWDYAAEYKSIGAIDLTKGFEYDANTGAVTMTEPTAESSNTPSSKLVPMLASSIGQRFLDLAEGPKQELRFTVLYSTHMSIRLAGDHPTTGGKTVHCSIDGISAAPEGSQTGSSRLIRFPKEAKSDVPTWFEMLLTHEPHLLPAGDNVDLINSDGAGVFCEGHFDGAGEDLEETDESKRTIKIQFHYKAWIT